MKRTANERKVTQLRGFTTIPVGYKGYAEFKEKDYACMKFIKWMIQ